MDDMKTWVLAIGIGNVACAFLSSWVASQKNRGPGEGFLLGLLFNALGVIVEALLPVGEQDEEEVPRRAPRRVETPLSGERADYDNHPAVSEFLREAQERPGLDDFLRKMEG